MATISITQGESLLVSRTFVQNDGETPLVVAELAAAWVRLIHPPSARQVGAFKLVAGGQLRAGAGADELVFEITPSISRSMAGYGTLTLRWELVQEDDDFPASGDKFVDCIDETLVIAN